MNTLSFECCFCGEGIKSTNIDPCDLSILTNIDKSKDIQEEQVFYCHIVCFQNNLHEEMKKHLVVHLKSK